MTFSVQERSISDVDWPALFSSLSRLQRLEIRAHGRLPRERDWKELLAQARHNCPGLSLVYCSVEGDNIYHESSMTWDSNIAEPVQAFRCEILHGFGLFD